MPHGHLTPLGRQLRTVLANLSCSRRVQHHPRLPLPRTRPHGAPPTGLSGARDFHDSIPSGSREEGINAPYQPFGFGPQPTTEEANDFHEKPFEHDSTPSRSREEEGNAQDLPFGPDPTTEKANDFNFKAFEPVHWSEEGEASSEPNPQHYLNRSIRSHDMLSEALERTGVAPREYRRNRRRDLPDRDKKVKPRPEISLQSIVASYLHKRSEHGVDDPLQADWENVFVPSAMETEFLREHGASVQDVGPWADLLLDRYSDRAAAKIADKMERRERHHIFLLLHSLRRKYISASALRTFIKSTSAMLESQKYRLSTSSKRQHVQAHNVDLLIAIVRLIRHAREVWPQSLPSIVSLFLGQLQYQDSVLEPESSEGLQFVTFALNKIMHLVSLATAVHPFKDNVFQEMAIIRALRYMDAHDPPLQISRQGFRAVVRVQLAQRKSPDEQQWAELKALSWPPWKVDRTAMDASVDLEYGITRARATLISMRNAGYKPLAWEKAAEVYSGWNDDGTPTIQKRVLLGSPHNDNATFMSWDTDVTPTSPAKNLTGLHGSSDHNSAVYWSARINSTRTIQEAWACYLAWEDVKLPHDQSIYLITMQKLYQQANAEREVPLDTAQRPAWDLLPGDTPRISPLPPSTHLETYTRTPPPTPAEFYDQLRAKGVHFTGYCLAFLISKDSLYTGLQRMIDSLPQYPELRGVLSLDPAHDLENIPSEVFTAVLELLSQFGGYFLDDSKWRSQINPDPTHKHHKDPIHGSFFPGLNRDNAIVRAVELLRRRPDCARVTWVVVFEGLTRANQYAGLACALDLSFRPREPIPELEPVGALIAYGIVRRLILLYREQFGDLDPEAFECFCKATEPMVIAVWSAMLLVTQGSRVHARVQGRVVKWDHDGRYIKNGEAGRKLREEFSAMVGAEDGAVAEEIVGGEMLPRLLFIPSPAMLHQYIRALGWLGDFEGLLELVEWMRRYREELAERCGRERSGMDMMRRAMVALRVFLERSWRYEKEDAGSDAEVYRPFSQTYRPEIDVRLSIAADAELIEKVRGIVESVEEWEGWADEMEVQGYIADRRFDPFRG